MFRVSMQDKLMEFRINKSMRLGASYSVWDGEELLEASLKSIRQEVDYINVVWQRYSWRGELCNSHLESLLEKLKADGLIDEIIFYDHLQISGRYPDKERDKRNVGLQAQSKQDARIL